MAIVLNSNTTINRLKLVLLITVYLISLNGCKDYLTLVKQEVDEYPTHLLTTTKSTETLPNSLRTKAKVETEVEILSNPYQTTTQRSPFDLPDFIKPKPSGANKVSLDSKMTDGNDATNDATNTPFENRSAPNRGQRHPLTYFKYRGMMSRMGGLDYGLVQRPDGIIISVKVGQSIGIKQIQVVEITPTQLNLVEKIESPQFGKTENRWALIAPVQP
ncbi:pilus assembly protein PilP [Psychrobacter sanguinis]|uniref:pilus assembly protein PilP n=1 Tax=Psychrobacter sanguinis TaxID=861445 RepID=UPI001D0FACAE|nr:pilus assembly protein PilP [Psychrobacter sanguinis]UEC25891.1 pilus assembly protein PilP [Psychrobacter sanguinis]